MTDFQRVAHHCEDAIKAKARERQLATLAQNQEIDAVREIFPGREENRARDELGAMAGVSGKTYEHAVTVLESAPEAKERRASTLKQNTDVQISAQRGDEGRTRDELAKVAGVSFAL